MAARPGPDASDQRVEFDAKRDNCPVDESEPGTWALLRHADVVAAANDPVTFSSSASRYLNVPNGMDGAEHRRYRDLIDRFLDPAVVNGLEPAFRQIASSLVSTMAGPHPVDAVSGLGSRFAVRAQSAWLGWPEEIEDDLIRWMEANREASRSRDPGRTREVANRFDSIIRSLIESRWQAGAGAPDDVTSALMRERVNGRPLSEDEIVSILRNWTAGDLGSIAACVGVIVHRLAGNPDLQERWRNTRPQADDLEAEIEEILRIDDPFTFNRRVATADVEVAGRTIRAGDRVLLNWTSANRDPEVMGDPDAFRPAENARHNLVFGTGPHACPGRRLSVVELRVLVEELLTGTFQIRFAPGKPAARAFPPYGGYRSVPVILTPG